MKSDAKITMESLMRGRTIGAGKVPKALRDADRAHTQGNWHADGCVISVNGRGVIARCPLPADGGVWEAINNARLIGALPQLVAALIDIAQRAEFEAERNKAAGERQGTALVLARIARKALKTGGV